MNAVNVMVAFLSSLLTASFLGRGLPAPPAPTRRGQRALCPRDDSSLPAARSSPGLSRDTHSGTGSLGVPWGWRRSDLGRRAELQPLA